MLIMTNVHIAIKIQNTVILKSLISLLAALSSLCVFQMRKTYSIYDDNQFVVILILVTGTPVLLASSTLIAHMRHYQMAILSCYTKQINFDTKHLNKQNIIVKSESS